MLIRAQTLFPCINAHLSVAKEIYLLSHEEWKQVQYLIELTKPFCSWTLAISEAKGPTTFLVLAEYKHLIEFLNKSKARLDCKRTPWKQELCRSLESGRQKLLVYLDRTTSSA